MGDSPPESVGEEEERKLARKLTLIRLMTKTFFLYRSKVGKILNM